MTVAVYSKIVWHQHQQSSGGAWRFSQLNRTHARTALEQRRIHMPLVLWEYASKIDHFDVVAEDDDNDDVIVARETRLIAFGARSGLYMPGITKKYFQLFYNNAAMQSSLKHRQ